VALRILFVEDDPDVRGAVLPALRDAGHDVLDVADGGAALDRLATDRFEVVVTDIRLPKADGLAIFRRAREVAPQTDVILMTSFGAVADAVAALKQGANDYLTKPFDIDELLIRLAAIARKRSLEQELEDARARLAGAADSRWWPRATRSSWSRARRGRARSSSRGAFTRGVRVGRDRSSP